MVQTSRKWEETAEDLPNLLCAILHQDEWSERCNEHCYDRVCERYEVTWEERAGR